MAEMSKSQIFAKLKKQTQGAFVRSKNVEAKPRGSTLPAGIKGGVAKFSNWELTMRGEKEDIPTFTLSGTIIEPDDVRGRRASVMYFINETQYNTLEESIEQLMSDIKLIAGDDVFDRLKFKTEDDLPRILDALVKEGPAFTFDTKANRKSGYVNVYIQGPADYEDDEGGSDEEPEEEQEEEQEEQEEEAEEAEGEEEEASEEGEGNEWAPEKDEVYAYKDGKFKPRNFIVTKVNESKRTVDLKSEGKPDKTLKGVSWDDLQDAL